MEKERLKVREGGVWVKRRERQQERVKLGGWVRIKEGDCGCRGERGGEKRECEEEGVEWSGF